ncbi:MAG: hypothetical protein Kow0075_12900 [Salibacteraceae bacterium]
MRALVNFLVYSNLFVALVLAVLTLSSYPLFNGLQLRWYVSAAVFAGAHLLYTFHRLYKIDLIAPGRLEQRHRWMLSFERYMKLCMAVDLLALLLLTPYFDADAVVWLVPAGILSIGYTVPFIPAENKWWRVRDIPLVKPLVIAAVVTYVTLCFPIFEQWGIASLASRAVWLAFSERFLFLLMLTIPFDVRDTGVDRDAGLVTLSTAFGVNFAKRFAIATWALWAIVFYFNHAENTTMFAEAVAFSLLPLAALLTLAESRSSMYYTMVYEGLILVYALLELLIFHTEA